MARVRSVAASNVTWVPAMLRSSPMSALRAPSMSNVMGWKLLLVTVIPLPPMMTSSPPPRVAGPLLLKLASLTSKSREDREPMVTESSVAGSRLVTKYAYPSGVKDTSSPAFWLPVATTESASRNRSVPASTSRFPTAVKEALVEDWKTKSRAAKFRSEAVVPPTEETENVPWAVISSSMSARNWSIPAESSRSPVFMVIEESPPVLSSAWMFMDPRLSLTVKSPSELTKAALPPLTSTRSLASWRVLINTSEATPKVAELEAARVFSPPLSTMSPPEKTASVADISISWSRTSPPWASMWMLSAVMVKSSRPASMSNSCPKMRMSSPA
mmetsp:Transcript_316/g.1092  ORF Transcript_316/g.1092 Transcript_316/m.1092 type:complete len:329 (-) Transcript_316:944-1930(-)